MHNKHTFVFFGTIPLAEKVLNELEKAGFLPSLIVAAHDGHDKKKHVIFPVEKTWAMNRNIPVIQPEKITPDVIEEIAKFNAEFFIVASYGKILPQKLLDIAPRGVINLHPSLLPKLRGPSPMRTAILEDMKDTGVTIMLLNSKMDEGPILAQKAVTIEPWPQMGHKVDELLSTMGAELLVEVLPKWLSGEVTPKEQSGEATYCKVFEKHDGQLDLSDDPHKNYLKVCAFDGWPGTYFFVKHHDKDLRVKVTEADFVEGQFVIKKVIPEGKKEMSWEDFERGHKHE